jgi:hypothetical protein
MAVSHDAIGRSHTQLGDSYPVSGTPFWMPYFVSEPETGSLSPPAAHKGHLVAAGVILSVG